MAFSQLVYHEYVEVRPDGFTQEFADWIAEHNGGNPVVELTPRSGAGGQGWIAGIDATLKAINEMIAREGGLIPPHELAKLETVKNELNALKTALAGATPQQKIAALEAAIAAIRALSMIPALSVFGLAVANFAMIFILGISIVELAGYGVAVIGNCHWDGARRLFRLLRMARQAQTEQDLKDNLENVQAVIDCAKNGGGQPMTYAQMAAADQEESGGTEGWDATYFNREGFEEQQSNPCPQCGQNPCICY